jgi:hypothetical protein
MIPKNRPSIDHLVDEHLMLALGNRKPGAGPSLMNQIANVRFGRKQTFVRIQEFGGLEVRLRPQADVRGLRKTHGMARPRSV